MDKKCGNCGWDGVTPLCSGEPKMAEPIDLEACEGLEEPTEPVWGKMGEWAEYKQYEEKLPQEGEWDSGNSSSDDAKDTDDFIRGCLVFYIDVGQLPPFKAEAFVERMKDQLDSKGGLKRIKRDQEIFFLPVRGGGTRVKYIPFH